MGSRALVPVALTGVLFAIAQGWLTSLWSNIYTVSHRGQTLGGALNTANDPFKSIDLMALRDAVQKAKAGGVSRSTILQDLQPYGLTPAQTTVVMG